MKVAAFTALHYGVDYLEYAIKSVAPDVDEWLFAYSPVGSHGHRTTVQCPESEAELKAAALRGLDGLPYQWWSANWPHEGAQRDSVYNHTDADLIIVVDADEVWADGAVVDAIEQGSKQETLNGRVPFIHFWRSFGWVCKDGAWPVRVLRPGMPTGDTYHDIAPVLHFGYAIRPHMMIYKWHIHGHKAEMRPNWLDVRFMHWSPDNGNYDLHPTNFDYWNAEPYAKEQLPDVLSDHPFYDLEVIR